MAASRRGQPELQVRLPPRSPAGISSSNLPSALMPLPDLPPISALFLIDFDVKAGYTISWKAVRPSVELDGVVEYKSLPSGLHTVSEDLIYFVHDGYAGLSAFINAPVDDTEMRNARMLAVGVLVPLSFGRLGRAWRHAEALRDMAQKLVANGKETAVLQEYWQKNQASEETMTQPEALLSSESLDTTAVTFQTPTQTQSRTPRKSKHSRKRSASDGAALLPPGHKLSPFHPAWSLTSLLDTFGPLIFPIHRAALLRKRILISCHAPVQEVCNFVYDISVLSNIPLSTYENLSPDCPPHRLRPLFTIGVHDIPFLVDDAKPTNQSSEQESESGTGWIACTTDSILAMKDTLWDMLITMPPPHAAAAKEHVWPKVECPKGVEVKATQRDLRRYRSLRAAMTRIDMQDNVIVESPGSWPITAQAPKTPMAAKGEDPYLLDAAEQIIEPLSWTALAYNGFMWWASAGEQARSDESEEASFDAQLLADFTRPSMARRPTSAGLAGSVGSIGARRLSSTATGATLPIDEAKKELAIIVFFHRLTSKTLTTAADVVESHSGCSDAESNMGEDEEEDALLEPIDDLLDGRGVKIGSERLKAMGLDRWSRSDIEFVKELVRVYFGRRASVEGKGLEVCGVRVC